MMRTCQNCKAAMRRFRWSLRVRSTGDEVHLCHGCCADALQEEKYLGVRLYDVVVTPV